MFGFGKRALRLNLALQGGGAHGAFTWGVLDRLLDEDDLDIGWVSGTSAGAVNAVAFAAGLAEGGRAGARDRLRAVWDAVQEAGVPDLLRLNPFLSSLTRSSAMGQLGALLSPYEFNPLGFDPLRRLLETQIDFVRLRAFEGIELLIAATDVATGRKKLFRRHELTVEAVLASTCLPQLHHAVEIGGRAYWDGGYSANPDLVTVAAGSPVGDTLLVLLNPVEATSLPRTARAIAGEVARVTFTQPLLRDIGEIVEAAREPRSRWRSGSTRAGRIAAHRFHMIEAGAHTASLPADSKLRPEREMLKGLHAAGRDEAGLWLRNHRRDVGRSSTVDLSARFLSPLAPLRQPPEGTASPEIQREAEAAAIAEKL